ncbi:MAG TPA: hypothetical protein VFH56_02225 [Acidimicrobiales bacterium]|nr:hypothetical protein [Acidimicrobiales bacterium]
MTTTGTTQTRPTTTITGRVDLVPAPNGDTRFGWTAITVNQAGYETRRGGYATEAAAQSLLDQMLDEAEAAAVREPAVDAFLDYVETHCDQCGSKLPASRRCTNCD